LALSILMTFASSSPGLIRLRISPFIVVDPGFMVDLGDRDTLINRIARINRVNRTRYPDKRDNLSSRSAAPVLAAAGPPF